MPFNSPGGSTLQRAAGRDVLRSAPLILCANEISSSLRLRKSLFNPLACGGNYNATSNNEAGTLAVDGSAVCYIWYSEEGTGRGRSPFMQAPPLAVSNVTAHRSPASVPVTVLLYNGPLLCGFNVPIKG